MEVDCQQFMDGIQCYCNLMVKSGYSNPWAKNTRTTLKRIGKSLVPGVTEHYEDLFLRYVAERGYDEKSKAYSAAKTALGRYLIYLREGRLPTSRDISMFMCKRPPSYERLCPAFREVVDSYDMAVKGSGLKPSTMRGRRHAGSSFLLDIQEKGATEIGAVDYQMVKSVFGEGYRRHGGPGTSRALRSFFRECEKQYPRGTFSRILCWIPNYPTVRKLCDFLTIEERDKVAAVLESDHSVLSKRDEAIAKLEYYCGFRNVDIANLRLDSVDMAKEEIRFCQEKTGHPVSIPLLSVVGNAIVEYVKDERPRTQDSDNIFLRSVAPYSPLSPSVGNRVANKLYEAAGIRQEPGRRKGAHAFRHRLATDLLIQGASKAMISEVLGHRSLLSIAPYLDADLERISAMNLDISAFSALGEASFQARSFGGPLAEDMAEFAEAESSAWRWGKIHVDAMRSLESMIAAQPGLTERELYEMWSEPEDGESQSHYYRRIRIVRRFQSSRADTAGKVAPLDVRMANVSPHHLERRQQEYSSPWASRFAEYERHLEDSLMLTASKVLFLHKLDRFWAENGQGKQPDEVISLWMKQREWESYYGWLQRTCHVKRLVRYWTTCGYEVDYPEEEVDAPIRPSGGRTPRKHLFTEEELKSFFYSCDNIAGEHTDLTRLVVPAYFRLLYSSGLRVFEARKLECVDVSTKSGIICVRHPKGHVQRRVVMHASLAAYLEEYDRRMEVLMPGRKSFFPDPADKPISAEFVGDHFDRAWYRYNDAWCIAYQLRHNFATRIINEWACTGSNFQERIVNLARCMGHTHIDHTLYYYNSASADLQSITRSKEATFNEIIPDKTNKFKTYDDEDE